ncbi:MAG TPA: AzlD domain-containing protein [Rectinemataceae bacterium]|nr:AzlD domain-containing protein [Rectinemataceae bacterium]
MPSILLAVLVMGLVTLACRAAPFLLFMKRRPPAALDFLQRYIPPMIMTILVLNGLKGIRFDRPPYGLAELSASVLVAALQLWRRNVLVSIGAGTALYMVLIRVL